MLVVGSQQCSVYRSSGLEGLDKFKDQSNICGNYLTPNDLAHLVQSEKIMLSQSSGIQDGETVEICTINIEQKQKIVCSLSHIYISSVQHKIDEEDAYTYVEYETPYIYYYDEDRLGNIGVYMFDSSLDLTNSVLSELTGIYCEGSHTEGPVEDTLIFKASIIILENQKFISKN